MATSFIRPSSPGPGVYTSWSAWATDVARAPGDIGIQDEAGTQTDAITLPALANLEMRFEADVRIEADGSSTPLIIPSGCTGLVIEAVAGKVVSFAQIRGGVVPALEYGAASGWSATNVRCEAGSTAVQGPAVSSGAVRCSNFTALATGTAWDCGWMEDVVFEDVTLRGDGVALRCNAWAGRMERVVLRGGYPWAAYASQCGWCGDAEMRSVDLRCTDTSGGIRAWNVDRSTIPAGKTVTIANVNLIGATAQTLASDYGLYLGSTPGGTLEIRNLQIKGFAIPWRTSSTADGHDYCNVPGVPLNGVAPADDSYPNKAWALGANDLSVDPGFVDEGAEDYRLSLSSECLGAGVNAGVTYDVLGMPFDLPPPIGAYAAADTTPPDVAGALTLDGMNIVVFFSEGVYGTDLLDPSAWSISPAGPVLGVITLGEGSSSVTIATTGLVEGVTYTISAPATLTDLAGNLINITDAEFTVPDLTPPYFENVVTDAPVAGISTITVEFSEAMDPVGLDTAENYAVAPVAGGVSVSVLGAVVVDSTHVELTVTPMTNGQTYRLSADNLHDLAGNLLVDTFDLAGLGWRPQLTGVTRIDGNNITLEFDTELLFDLELTNPANYVFTNPGPGGAVTADSVTVGIPTSIIGVTVTPAFTPGEWYTITVSSANIRDVYQNYVDPAHDDWTFEEPGIVAQVRGFYFVDGSLVSVGERVLVTSFVSTDRLNFGVPEDLPTDPTDLSVENPVGSVGVLKDGWPPSS